MKTTFLTYISAFCLIVLLHSCNGCNDNKNNNDSINIVGVDSLPSIIELSGIAGDGTSMNVLELISENGDTISINTPGAMIMGGVNAGDKIKVVYYANNEENLASVAVNLSALQHLWTQKGADGQDQSLELDENGVAVTYNMSIEYVAWDIKDGLLLLHSPKKIASEKGDVVDSFQIMSLTEEELVLTSHRIETIFKRDN